MLLAAALFSLLLLVSIMTGGASSAQSTHVGLLFRCRCTFNLVRGGAEWSHKVRV